jgi:hypothetical protein
MAKNEWEDWELEALIAECRHFNDEPAERLEAAIEAYRASEWDLAYREERNLYEEREELDRLREGLRAEASELHLLTKSVQAMRDGYTDDWPILSRLIRADLGWQCKRCWVILSDRHDLLHLHHKNQDKLDNRQDNLIPLCVLCHAEEPGHEHLLKLISLGARTLIQQRRETASQSDWQPPAERVAHAINAALPIAREIATRWTSRDGVTLSLACENPDEGIRLVRHDTSHGVRITANPDATYDVTRIPHDPLIFSNALDRVQKSIALEHLAFALQVILPDDQP